MKSNKINILRFVLVQLLFWSCDSMITNVNPSNLNVPASKLNLNCYLSPQDTRIVAFLTESVPLFSTDTSNNKSYFIVTPGGDSVLLTHNKILNAKILLSNGTKTEQFKQEWDGGYNLFASDMSFKILPGATYTITASDGKREVSATCTVPTALAGIGNYKINLDSSGSRNGNVNKIISIETEFTDAQTQLTYYRMVASAMINDPSSVLNHDQKFNIDYPYDARFNPAYFTNQGLIGQNIKILGNINLGKILPTKPNAIKPVITEMNLGLFVVDYNYYTFFTTLRSSINNSDNPFVEPTPTFSNIKGGLGCFGAVNRSLIKIPAQNLPSF